MLKPLGFAMIIWLGMIVFLAFISAYLGIKSSKKETKAIMIIALLVALAAFLILI